MTSAPSSAALPPIPAKRYFTIGEVSELCGVKPHILRYWEQEVVQLKPVKRRGNRRYDQHHEVLLVRRIRGIRRAAFGPTVPTKTGKCIIIDSGANAEGTPEFLLQFGCMGSFCAKKTMGIESPRVGLLNIGAEDTKGTAMHKEAYALLQKASESGLINFIGNVEARDVPLGEADVVVCDGFSGNVLLKGIEGTAMFMGSELKKMFSSGLGGKLGYLCVRGGVNKFKKLLDYREVGGTMLLGISRPIIKAHGSSDALAIQNAVRQAKIAVESGIVEEITSNIPRMKAAKE